uniref:Proteasome 26S subunit, non-ATPase 12 n=1 Tax=Eptatretus burgeri TaxID=7764 RepID=A0A8C4NCG7_EPTBU
MTEVGDGRIVKMEVDCSSMVDQKLPECQNMSKDGKLQEAIEQLLTLEKQTRTACDMTSTSRILVAIVQMCFEARDWEALNENIITLTKRRSQLKQAVAKMVQECCEYVEQTPDLPTKLALIDTLRTVTAGKIYVEIERARLTRILAHIKEEKGELKEASSILQELQVETFGSMEKKEKVEFILEQMRLCLAVKDYIRTQIISKKINTKFFQDENTEALKSVVLYVVLAPYDNEQSDLVHRIGQERKLEELSVYREFLKLFTTSELMYWTSLLDLYAKELRDGTSEHPAPDVFDHTPAGDARWKILKNRLVEHNIRVMAKYYTRISMNRISELLDLSVDVSTGREGNSRLWYNASQDAFTLCNLNRRFIVVFLSRRHSRHKLCNSWIFSLLECDF